MSSMRSLILAFVLLQQLCLAQTIKIRGTVRNELSSRFISEANVRVYGTTLGTSTDKNGNFTLVLAKLPATIIVSCIGYERARYDILERSAVPLAILLRPVTYELKEVEISPVNHSVLYQDKTFSVLDYELMDDNVVMLVFRNVAKRAGMVLLSRGGDTLAVEDLPELPPDMLCKDFLSNVHYYAKTGKAYQCYYDPEIHSLGFL
ncbi:MAG: carboxypeptidase-like regulatory domain-containing protein, partial [Bacteroidales bacterium]